MIFFALALSWVKELSENVLPKPEFIKLSFEKNKADGRGRNAVIVQGISGNGERTVQLTPTIFNLLYKFAENKKSPSDGWMEIKPKNFDSGKRTYDINDYNEIKRLLFTLLDGLFGKGNWTREHHLNPLKSVLFEMSEKRERKIRLAIPSENITL